MKLSPSNPQFEALISGFDALTSDSKPFFPKKVALIQPLIMNGGEVQARVNQNVTFLRYGSG